MPTRRRRSREAQSCPTGAPSCVLHTHTWTSASTRFQPFVGSDVVAECFAVASLARELDVRASPYDVTAFGLEPVRVETVEGRLAYADAQRALMADTAPLRARLVGALTALRRGPARSSGGPLIGLEALQTDERHPRRVKVDVHSLLPAWSERNAQRRGERVNPVGRVPNWTTK